MNVRASALLVLGVLTLPSCGGKVGEQVRPKDLTAQSSLGVTPVCTGEPKLVRPLVVDLDPDIRVDVEARMKKKGVVVVAYDCQTLRVLSNCNVGESEYEYARVTKKETVLQLKNADEVQANLPLSAGKVGGEIKSGRTLDLGLVYTGRRTTLVGSVNRSELKGTCEGATHFLQNATLGAFSMATGSSGKVSAIGELFKVGASGSSESTRSAANTDGSIEACRAADPALETPPQNCSAPVRVELTPIKGKEKPETETASAEPKAEKSDAKGPAAEVNPCAKGLVFAGGICTRSTEAAHLCDWTDEAECKAQCEKGSLESCFNHAQNLKAQEASEAVKSGDYTKKPEAAMVVWGKACEAGHAESCAALGSALRPLGTAPAAEARPWVAKSFPPLKSGCDMGSAWACSSLASVQGDDRNPPTYDLAASFRTERRACSLGDALSCTFVALDYAQGKGVKKDPDAGLAYFQKACDAGSPEVCHNLAEELRTGEFFSRDLERALKVQSKACEARASDLGASPSDTMAKIHMSTECDRAAELAREIGKFDVAFGLATKACGGIKDGCLTLAQLQETGKGTKKDVAAANAVFKEVCKEATSDDMRIHPACPGYLASLGGAPAKSSATKPKATPKTAKPTTPKKK